MSEPHILAMFGLRILVLYLAGYNFYLSFHYQVLEGHISNIHNSFLCKYDWRAIMWLLVSHILMRIHRHYIKKNNEH